MKLLPPLLAVPCACALPSAFAQDAHPRDQAYRWVELGFGAQSASTEDGFGASADGAYRLAGMAPIGGPIYLVGSYTGTDYPYQFLDWLSGGFGVRVPIAPDMDAIAQLTYEQVEVQNFGEDGTGIETGLRWFGGASELGLTVDYYELDGFGGTFRDRYWGMNLVALVQLTRRIAVTARIERTFARGDFNGDDTTLHTYLAGVRVGF